MKYVIINSNEISSMDFSQLLTSSADTLRCSIDETKAIVKFKGTTPSFLSGKTQYNHSQMLAMVNDVDGEWYSNEES
jgi:hypothetical protein|tara:strand:+ start:1859 stop:2089 length:231 start_codon:yes stop_codon:yes gene_type:complete